MGVVITVANQKGGVGKTTIAFNLVKELAQRQHRILAIDNDPQGNLTTAVLKDISSLTANMIDVYKADDASVEPQDIIANLDFIGADIRLARVADQSDDIIYRLSEYRAVKLRLRHNRLPALLRLPDEGGLKAPITC